MGKRRRQKVEKVDLCVVSNDNKPTVEDESDDELPCALSPMKKKLGNEFKRGDLVFAKFARYPYWPGLFFKYSTSKTKRKGLIYFFEAATLGNKKILAVPSCQIKCFSCEEKTKFLEAGSTDPDFASGLERANDYLRKRACNKIKDFFKDVEESMEFDDGNEGGKLDGQLPALTTTTSIDDVEKKCTEKKCTEKKEPLNFRKRLSEIRKSKRQQGLKSKEFLEWIHKHSRPLLREITEGTRTSLRHKTFVSGRQKDKDGLKWMSGYGPIESADESEALLKTLVSWHVEDYPKTSYNPITYVSDVWLPEVIIHAIANVKTITYDQAEEQFLNGC